MFIVKIKWLDYNFSAFRHISSIFVVKKAKTREKEIWLTTKRRCLMEICASEKKYYAQAFKIEGW